MRSWYPISPVNLDNKRLLGEHNELLIMARCIAYNRKGWANHPETNRWRGYSKAMKNRHDAIAREMVNRGMNHKSPWPKDLVTPTDTNNFPNTIEPIEVMREKLRIKMTTKQIIRATL